MSEYDAIIVGAGPNGLTLANYLMRCGQKVLVVERRFEVGGNLITEDFGGARYNLHALYISLGDEMPPYQDLGLAEHGCSFVDPVAQATVHTKGSNSLTLYRDAESSIKSISKVSDKDAKKFRKLFDDLRSLRNKVMLPWMYNAPQPTNKYKAWLDRTAEGKFAQESNQMSPVEILGQHYGFETEELKLLLLYLGCMWGIEPKQNNVGNIFLFLLDCMLSASLVRGGSYLLASSLYKPLIMGGSDVWEGREVTEITVENGAAIGVRLSDGRKIRSKIVVSTLDVRTTFEKLLENTPSTGKLTEIARSWKWDPWSLFQVHWTVRVKPNFKSSESIHEESLMHLVGYESVDDFLSHIKLASRGETMAAGCVSVPSLLDGSQAPSGLNAVKFTSITPFELSSGKWDDLKEEFGRRCFACWSSLTTNVTRESAIAEYIYPPSYIEMKLANCINGSLNSGAYVPEQLGINRPDEHYSSYGTPLSNLYVCGASVHPGGMVTLAGGYNAATRIAEDLGLKRWWAARYNM